MVHSVLYTAKYTHLSSNSKSDSYIRNIYNMYNILKKTKGSNNIDFGNFGHKG